MNEDDDDSDNESTLSKEEYLDDQDYTKELETLNDDAGGDLDELLSSVSYFYFVSKSKNWFNKNITYFSVTTGVLGIYRSKPSRSVKRYLYNQY